MFPGSARAVIGHALSPAAEALYRRHGLMRLPAAPPTPALDLVKLQKVAEGVWTQRWSST